MMNLEETFSKKTNNADCDCPDCRKQLEPSSDSQSLAPVEILEYSDGHNFSEKSSSVVDINEFVVPICVPAVRKFRSRRAGVPRARVSRHLKNLRKHEAFVRGEKFFFADIFRPFNDTLAEGYCLDYNKMQRLRRKVSKRAGKFFYSAMRGEPTFAKRLQLCANLDDLKFYLPAKLRKITRRERAADFHL